MTAHVEVEVRPVAAVVSEDEVLSEFARVMREWGHYKTAKGLRFPTRAEVAEALAGFPVRLQEG